MKYFAYGSNMSIARLKRRTPGARRIGYYLLRQHDLRFHKASLDRSGKCDAYFTGDENSCVIGVLFEIDPAEKPALDKAEGLGFGYQEKTVHLFSPDGETPDRDTPDFGTPDFNTPDFNTIEATTYYAMKIDRSLNPYSWYLNHVLIGARESGLPHDYITAIEAVKSIQDQDKNRDKQERSIHREII